MHPPAAAGFAAPIVRRWRGEVPLARMFWRDMIGVGSLLNLAASIGALILLAHGAPAGVAAALHFAPLPLNAFLFAAVWRNGRRSPLTRTAALAWLLIASLV